jgi:hypothetical protein
VSICALLALTVLSAPGGAKSQQAKWTFAIYLCSDNDLDEWGEMNTEQLMSVGSTKDVNFVVFWDPSTGPANLYYIAKGEMIEKTNFAYNGKEVNMGDPAVLEVFVDYLKAKYKAENVLVDLWDHGDDFRGICFDYDTGTDVERDYLTHQEIVSALDGKGLSILAADGCGIGTIEVAYEYALGEVADWFVANQNYVPLEGFPYDLIAQDLVSAPSMSAEQLSADIVLRYAEYYQGGWLTELAAIDLAAIEPMVEELWDVAAILMSDMETYKDLLSAGRGHAMMGWSQYGWEGTVDFATIFEVVFEMAAEGSELKAETGELLAAFETAVPYVGAGSPADVWDPEGLSVFFPGSLGSYVNNVYWRSGLFELMQFAQDGWMELLYSYYAASD